MIQRSKSFPMKFSFFASEKNLCILHGQVFIMGDLSGAYSPNGTTALAAFEKASAQVTQALALVLKTLTHRGAAAIAAFHVLTPLMVRGRCAI